MTWFLSAIEQLRLERLKFPEVTELRPPPTDMMDTLARRALAVGYRELGKGELAGRNNRGPDIARYCAPHGDGHAWCAGFLGYTFEVAADELVIRLPFRRSLRAKTLAENIAAVGRWFTDYREALPGDVGIIGRVGGNHVFFVSRITSGSMITLEGNHGPKVGEERRYPDKLPSLRFASLRSTRTHNISSP